MSNTKQYGQSYGKYGRKRAAIERRNESKVIISDELTDSLDRDTERLCSCGNTAKFERVVDGSGFYCDLCVDWSSIFEYDEL